MCVCVLGVGEWGGGGTGGYRQKEGGRAAEG